MILKSYRNNITLNYLFTFLRSFNLTHGLWMIYLMSKGMTLFELGLLEGIFHITSLVMETPTGAIADLYGRRFSRILGVISYYIYITLCLISSNFFILAIGFIFCSLSYTLESGAGTAFVYDSLKETNDDSKFMKINGLIEGFYQGGIALAIFLGGFIALVNIDYTYLLMYLIISLALISTFFMKETPIHHNRDKGLKHNLINQYKDTFKVLKNNSYLFFLICTLPFIGILSTIPFFYLQNYWVSQGFKENIIGIFLALNSVAGVIGGLGAYRVERLLKQKGILVVIPIIFTILLWMLPVKYMSFGAIIGIGFVDSIFFVVLTDYMNRIIPSDKRATIISFESMVYSFYMILIFPVFGLIGDSFNLTTSFIILAVVASLIIGLYLIFIRINYHKF